MLGSLSADRVVDSRFVVIGQMTLLFFFKVLFLSFSPVRPVFDFDFGHDLFVENTTWRRSKVPSCHHATLVLRNNANNFCADVCSLPDPPDSDWRTRMRLTGLFWLEKLFWVRNNDSDRWQGSRLWRCEVHLRVSLCLLPSCGGTLWLFIFCPLDFVKQLPLNSQKQHLTLLYLTLTRHTVRVFISMLQDYWLIQQVSVSKSFSLHPRHFTANALVMEQTARRVNKYLCNSRWPSGLCVHWEGI